MALRSELETDIPFLRDHDERDYVKMLETFICDRTDRHNRIPGVLSDCLLGAPGDSLPLPTWSKVWREAARYAAKHRVSDDEAYFLGWHNRELFMIPRKERAELYAQVPN